MRDNLKFRLPNGFNRKKFISDLAEHFAIKKEPTVVENFTIYDTFDWRLFHKSLVFYTSGSKLFLRKLSNNKFYHSAQCTSLPVFIWDFPDGELKEHLAPIMKIRGLLKLVDVYSRSTTYRILNRDEKTVARLVYEDLRSSSVKNASALAKNVWLKPVEGYPKYSRKLFKQFEKAGLSISKEEDIYFKALKLAGKKPGSYSAKVDIQLDPAMRSDEATKSILRFLLQIMQINAAHIYKDLDTEFLHDFRVAVRRTRSALGQIKSVFATKTTDRFKKDFAFVGKLTNELRDLDVYLLNEDSYKALLPPVLRDDIDPLFEYLHKKRSRALQNVIRNLKTKRYAGIIDAWEAFLNAPPQDFPDAKKAELPISDLACKRIYKKYLSVVEGGNQILDNAEDEMLHVLRIHCKKLRYLMEFLCSLFPPKKIKVLIQQLKKLQGNLGDFHDLCVQEEYLLNIAREMPANNLQTKKALVAIGCLIGTLDRERQIAKDAFTKKFTDFSSPANRGLFQDLFAPQGSQHGS